MVSLKYLWCNVVQLILSLSPQTFKAFSLMFYCRYFFAEVFDFFRNFFLIVFHGNILFMILPLAIRLKHRPFFMAFVYIAISSMLKSYPSVSSLSLIYLPGLEFFVCNLINTYGKNCSFSTLTKIMVYPIETFFFIVHFLNLCYVNLIGSSPAPFMFKFWLGWRFSSVLGFVGVVC